MKRIGDFLEFIEWASKKDVSVVILGASKYGFIAANWLKKKGVSVRAILDDDSRKSISAQNVDMPILPPEQFDWGKDDVGLVCIGKFSILTDQEIVSSDFIKRAGSSQENLFVWDRSMAIEQRLMRYFESRSIDIQKDTISIDTLTIPNYLKMGEHVRKAFLLEAPDLLLPSYFNDEFFMDEGSYADNSISVRGGGAVVFDCGANIGLFSAIAASRGAEVHAFEPVKAVIDILSHVQTIYPNVHCVPVAVSNRNGDVFMKQEKRFLTDSKIADKMGKDVIKVRMQTLDDYAEEKGLTRVDFIKADIEGVERDMLLGAKRILREYAPLLSLCTYHLTDDPEVMEEIITTANPKYKVIHKEKKLFAYV